MFYAVSIQCTILVILGRDDRGFFFLALILYNFLPHSINIQVILGMMEFSFLRRLLQLASKQEHRSAYEGFVMRLKYTV
jgi:hypothetical protein